ncbi:MAG TPA: DUF1800 domain-containing protein [Flavobacteriales bacterium]|nr:DUF1800 domain-containing protein [Flavobacteriales bacterium]HNE79958.1 DUF1800 domain-containing protein [Flavobacteriales bacterium]HNK84069.1 DUF1800 domain-containing protein [Flavobacteriales bacterium]
MAITPYTGPFTDTELRHLLRRTLFGCSNADLDHFAGQTLQQVVDALLTFSNDTTPPVKTYWLLNGNTPDPTLIDANVPFGNTWINTPRQTADEPTVSGKRIESLVAWRTGLLAQQDRTLREKLTLFWNNLVPTEASTVFNPEFMYAYDQLLRDHAAGNFRELIHDVATSGAMLLYLNGYLNNYFAPDENFARELMELFTLGEGTGYTEEDVQTAARVLTGWTIQVEQGGQPIIPQTIFVPFLHDSGDKTFSAFFNNTVISGQTGPDAGETELNALLDMIMAKEEASLHVCRKLYRFFVHGGISEAVETGVIAPLAELFRDNAGAPDQMRIVMEALLTSDHFFSTDVRACMIQPPVDLVVGNLRRLDFPYPTAAQLEARYAGWMQVYSLVAYCGQPLFQPPNVAGWPAYHQFPQYDEIWMDTTSYPARSNTLAGILFAGFTTDGNMYEPSSQNLEFKADLLAVVAQFSDPADPNVLVQEAADLLFAVPISAAVRDQLKSSFLLFGQTNDLYWTYAYTTYVADPQTTDMAAQLVPVMLQALFNDMRGAAEIQLF